MSSGRQVLLADRVRAALLRISAGALVLATLVLCFSEYFEALGERTEYAETMARLVAENSKAALAFNDPRGVQDALAPLRREETIVSAYIHGLDGTVLGTYPGNAGSIAPHATIDALQAPNEEPATAASLSELTTVLQIRDGVQTLGELHLTVSMRPAYESMLRFSALTIMIMLFTFVATIPVANAIGRRIVAPVRLLADTMTEVAGSNAFSTRAIKHDDDEVGSLVDRFNELLAQLQARDKELQERHDDLESQVAERTHELLASNESLRRAVVEVEEARDEAQQASEAKGQFLANMSHEIRSPLNGVIGMAELLSHTPLNDRQAHFCRTIQTSSKALLGVLNDVLDLSKIDAGSMQIETVEFDLLDLAEESVLLFAESASRHSIELVCSTNIDRHLRVRGDPIRLRQVLINLLSNAVKFTERGDVVLEVRDLIGDSQPGHFSFSVRDTGIGISKEEQSRIFDAFVQADGSTSRRYGGTGLGLAISNSIVALLGGSLQVVSEEGRGSTFSFTLPIGVGAQTKPVRSFAIRDAEVLVIDSHDASAQNVLQYLRNWQARPTLAQSIDSAKTHCAELAQRGGFAAIVVNYEYPGGPQERLHGMDSEALPSARALTAHDAGSATPALDASLAQILAMSAQFAIPCLLYSSVGELADLGERVPAGTRLLAKPLRQSELFNAVNDLVQGTSDKMNAQPERSNSMVAGLQVLLVEDNPVNQEVAREHLVDLGCVVTVCNHGGEAVAQFKRQRFDLVLMDCQMPIMDGYEATRHIRIFEQEQQATLAQARTPIIALTANALKGDRDRCLVVGMDDFLPKPFRLVDLEQMLQRWNKRNEASAGAAPNAAAPAAAPLIDEKVWQQIQSLAARSPGFQTRVLGALTSEAAKLEAALLDPTSQSSELAFIAHRVKSSANSVGALQLGDLLGQLEAAARTGLHTVSASSIQPLATANLVASTRTVLRATMDELHRRTGLVLEPAEPQRGATASALPIGDTSTTSNSSIDQPAPAQRAAPAAGSEAATRIDSAALTVRESANILAAEHSDGVSARGDVENAWGEVESARGDVESPRAEPDSPIGKHGNLIVRVLVADDDIVSRSVVCSWLRDDGYEVTEVDDGIAAQTAFANARFDLVLLDVLMPGCDGFEACAAIRKLPRGRHVPILMLTGLDDTESIHRAYTIGATDFLIKPIAEEILRHRMRYIHRAQAALAQLRESEARLRRAQDTARVSYWEWSPATQRLTIGEGALRLLPLDQTQNSFPLSDILPFIAEADRGPFDQLAEGGTHPPPTSEFRMTDRGGNELLMQQQIEQLVDDDTGEVRWLATVQDITERRRNEQRIYRISHFDAVTGLPNQNLLRKSVQALLKLADRRSTRLAYLVIDSGEQQMQASSLGHEYNERFLLELSSRLRTQLRESDLVAPLREPGSEPGEEDHRAALVHGDRFAAVLNDAGSNDDVTRLCERLIGALSAPIELGDQALFPTINIGISIFPDDGRDYEILHQHALTALSQRSADTQSGWHWYQHERDAAARQRIALERDLRFAVERGEIRVFFQPRVDAASETPLGMEALARWQRNGEWIPPVRFIPIAEQTGIICQLGEHVLDRSVAMLGSWLRRGLPPLRVSVNVSGQQFRESNLPVLCANALDRYKVPGDFLELELTEGILIDASDQVLQQLQALKALGIRLALDDFGTGFSSLAYLSRFPLDVLKIDRGFVDQISENRQNRVIVRSTLNLAHDLGLTVVAEGVETAQQRDWLAEQGCDELQGYLFSKPVPEEEFERWVLQHASRVVPRTIGTAARH